ncbi:MAG: PAS domain-containing protein [Gemmatales bacterium]
MPFPSNANDLRESEERLRLAFWAANIGFWTWDQRTQEVYLSPIWKSQLGYEDHELPNALSTWEKLLHPDDREHSWKIIEAARSDPQRVFEIYFRLRHKNGSYRWLLSRGRVYRDEQGQPVRIMGCHVDVSQQKEDERLLRESEARLQLTLDGGRMGLWNWDIQNNSTHWNRREFELIDEPYTSEGVTSEAFFKRVHPDDVGPLRSQINYALEHDGRFEAEFRIIRQDGSIRWLAGVGQTVNDPVTQKPVQMIGVNYDITERKLAEAKLLDNQQRMALLLEQLPCILWTTDCDLRFTSSMGSGIAALGMKHSDTVGKLLTEFLHSSDEELLAIKGHRKALQGHTATYSEAFSGRYFHVRIQPLRDIAGNIVGTVGVAQDVTEQKQQEEQQRELEQRLQHAQKLESLEVLAGGIAHDFNNLLTGMLGYSSLALAELSRDAAVVPMIHEIEKAAQRAAELSRQMLAYSGKGKFVIETIRLDQLVNEMVGLLRTIVSSKAHLHLTLEPASIEGDATQIRQVVMNLITNASDAVQNEGVIVIRTGQRFFPAHELHSRAMQSQLTSGEYVFLEVEDNGTGIPAATLDKIFDPFFTTKFTGRGLGLASVRGIVRGHRGLIQVESSIGSGTRFRIILPVASSDTSEAVAVSPPPAVAKVNQGTILVVEDEPAVMRFIQFVLEQAGYVVVTGVDGQQGLQLFNERMNSLSLAVIDLTMPQINGIEMVKQIRKQNATIPVILMSGYAEEDVTLKASGLCYQGFLQKPFRPQELLSIVRQTMAAAAK